MSNLTKFMARYQLFKVFKVATAEQSFDILINRSNRVVKFEGAQIWKDMLMTNRYSAEMVKDIAEYQNLIVSYEVKMDEITMYDRDVWMKVMTKYYKVKVKISAKAYTEWNSLTTIGSTLLLPTYISNPFERSFFAKENIVVNHSFFTEKAVEESVNIRRAYIDLLKSKKKDWVKEEVPDDETIASTVASLKYKRKVTMSEIRNYLKNRHEMFVRAFCLANSLPITSTDTKFKDKFYNQLKDEYPEALEKTPDLILSNTNLTNDILVMEFSVTNSNWSARMQDKLDKYSVYINHLVTMHSMNIQYYVVVLDMNNMEVHYSSSAIQFNKPALEHMKRLEMMLLEIPNYRELRSILDRSDFQDTSLITEKLSVLVDLLKSEELEEIKAASLRNSREMDKNLVFLTAAEDEVFQELKKRKSASTPSTMASDIVKNYSRKMASGKIFGPELEEIARQATREGAETIKEHIKTLLLDGSTLRSKTKEKIPSFFKFPCIRSDMAGVAFLERLTKALVLDDGTHLYKGRSELEVRRNVEEWTDQLDKKGIGFNEEDTMSVFRMMELLSRTSVCYTLGRVHEQIEDSEMMRLVRFWEVVAREIMLMSERRFASSHSPDYFAFKEFDNFSIEMHKGPKISKGKIVRVKFHIMDNDAVVLSNDYYHRYYTNMEDIGVKSTKWLTFTLTDLEHFITLGSRIKVLFADMEYKIQEDPKMNKEMCAWFTKKEDTLPPLFMTPAMIMMEHKRNTSTSAQIPRYIFHACTSALADLIGVAKEVVNTPVRSILQAHLVRMQLKWMEKYATTIRESWKFYVKMANDPSAYDRFHSDSFYDPNFSIEFSLTMNEIYYSNIFNQAHGMKSHREKQIMDKMAKEEINYSKVKERLNESIPFSEFLNMADTHHLYSSEFVRTAVKNWMIKDGSKESVVEALIHAETETLDDVIKMTKSVTGAPTLYRKFLGWRETIVKETVLEAVMDEFSKLSETVLRKICEEDKFLVAIFGTFAKDQFGSPREILIQAIRTRIHTAYLNSFFKKLCQFHSKEMITKEMLKREIQSSTMESLRSDYAAAANKESEDFMFPITMNADASKWAQAMIMDYFIESMSEMEDATGKRDYFCSVFRAYGSKLLFAPESLVKKWRKKPRDIRETSDSMEWIRDQMDSETGEMWFFSGMGQGNFQHPSSFFHCIMDDLSDEILEKVLSNYNIRLTKMTTLISSDDLTKMMMVSIKRPKSDSEDSQKMLHSRMTMSMMFIADVFTTCRKAANIHINWKKTAVQAIVTEFNSVFSIGKRVAVASIKSIYNCMNIVDMSFPERAVKEALSHIKPLMDDGVACPVIVTALREMRKNLIKWYNLDAHKEVLMMQLDCEEEDLPFHLGFLSIKNPYEQLIYGPECNIFTLEDNSRLMTFYKGLYTAPVEEFDDEEYWMSKNEAMAGSFKIKLDTRLNKIMENKKKERIRDRAELSKKDILNALNQSVNNSTPNGMDFYMQKYWSDINMMYEFGETFRINSMIRAMQLSQTPFTTTPPIWEEVTEDDNTMLLARLAKRFQKDIKGNLRKTRFTSVVEFVSFCISRSNLDTSLTMYYRLKEIMTRVDAAKKVMYISGSKRKTTHSKIRRINFFDVTTSANANTAQILDCIFNSKMSAKTRVYKAVLEVCSALKMDIDVLFSRPFDTILAVFTNKERAFENFRRFLDFYTSTMYNKAFMILSAFSSADKAVDNIVMAYSYNTSPGFYYDTREGVLGLEYENKLADAMLFLDTEKIPEKLYKSMTSEQMKISELDTRAEWAVKILAKMYKRRKSPTGDTFYINSNVPMSQIAKNRVLHFYKASPDFDELFFASTNCSVKIKKALNIYDKEVTVSIYEDEDNWVNFEIDAMTRGLVVAELAKIRAEFPKVKYRLECRISTKRMKDIPTDILETNDVEEIMRKLKTVERGLELTEKPEVTIERAADRWWIKVFMFNSEEVSEIKRKASFCVMTDLYKMTADPEFADEEQVMDLTAIVNREVNLEETINIMTNMKLTKPMTVPEHSKKVRKSFRFDIQSLIAMAEKNSAPDFQKYIKKEWMDDMGRMMDQDANLFSEGTEEAEGSFLVMHNTNTFLQLMDTIADFDNRAEVEYFDKNLEINERPVIIEEAYACLWNCFTSEFVIYYQDINRASRNNPTGCLSFLFSQIKEAVEEFVGTEVGDEIIMYLTISISKRCELIFRLTEFTGIRNLIKTREFPIQKNFSTFVKAVELDPEEDDIYSKFDDPGEEDDEEEDDEESDEKSEEIDD